MIKIEDRQLFVPQYDRILGIRDDNKAETRSFQIDRYYEGVDLAEKTCVLWYVNGNTGNSGLIDVEVQNNKILITWLIDAAVTVKKGPVLVHLQFLDEDYNMQTAEGEFWVGVVHDISDEQTATYPNEFARWENAVAASASRAEEFAHDAQGYADAAASSAAEIEDLTVAAESLDASEDATVTKTIDSEGVHLMFGIPRGATGVQGETGPAGADAPEITDIEIDDDYHLIVTLSDESSYDAGYCRGATGEQGETGSTGETGPAGADAPEITDISIDANYHLIITLSDSSSYDAGYCRGAAGPSATTATATLSSSDWSDNTQTVSVTGVTSSNTVIVAPAPTSQIAYSTAQVICTAQGSGTLTFTCQTVPSSNLTVNVVIL